MAAIPADGAAEFDTFSAKGDNIDGLVTVYGSCELNGAANPINVRGKGFTLEYQDVGEINIVFTRRYAELVYCEAHVGGVTPGTVGGGIAEITPFVVATRTCSFNIMDIDTSVFAENDFDGPRLYFKFVFQPNQDNAQERDT